MSVGVKGGLSILVHGMRIALELNPRWVVVKIDIRNAFNECSRAVMLRRLSRLRSLQHWIPMLHRLWGPETMLLVGQLLSELFEGERPGGSSEGTQQGTPPSAPGFCVSIHNEIVALDKELNEAGGFARFIADDGYATGPPELVFQTLERF